MTRDSNSPSLPSKELKKFKRSKTECVTKSIKTAESVILADLIKTTLAERNTIIKNSR